MIRKICLKSGKDIKTNHSDCRKCRYFLITTCSGFGIDGPVELGFHDWFMTYRGVKPSEPEDCINTQSQREEE